MGASIVLRHAALLGGTDAVISVSGPGWWYYRGTKMMRWVHLAIEHRPGRLVSRTFLNTRISPQRWDPVPMPPDEAAARIAPVPLLIIHGDRDNFFPVQHARRLYEAAGEPKELWLEAGFGHAESSASPALIERIGSWARTAVSVAASPNAVA
jgi:alpha-beta hydrolase superfamily lysophospholipase